MNICLVFFTRFAPLSSQTPYFICYIIFINPWEIRQLRHIITILKWEIHKILSSWQKTLAIFLVPAAVMVFAINLFPKLLNYLTTGTMGAQNILVINAPQSFIDFGEKYEGVFSYTYTDSIEIDSMEDLYELVENGDIVLEFSTTSNTEFEEAVRNKYRNLYQNNTDDKSEARVVVVYNDEKLTASYKTTQFEEDVLSQYMGQLTNDISLEFQDDIPSEFSTDDFNPITYILDHRSEANPQAARVIPGIMVILMYYCVYSLSCDMIAMEKNRGFLNKLIMTPVSAKNILWGKALSINVMVCGSSIATFLFLFLSSWLNRSNDAGSLLPFGLMLMPEQVIYMLLSIPASVLVMTAFCFYVSLTIEKFEDATANLQFVLLLLMFAFFIQMFNMFTPVALEYVIPFHNTIVLLKDTLNSSVNIIKFIVVTLVNLGLGLVIMDKCARKMIGGRK